MAEKNGPEEMKTVTVELNPRQLEILVQALSMYVEELAASMREGTYSAINADRRRIAHEVRSLLLAADAT